MGRGALTKRTTNKADTRRLLLDAARETFASVGYQGATLDDIAAHAGFTKGALYWHFPNKQAIFVSLIAEAIELNYQVLSAMVVDSANDPQSLRERLGEWVDGIDERERLPLFGVELEIEARRDPSFRALHQGMISKHEESLTGFLERYFATTGEAPPMPVADISATIITLLKGFALSLQNRPKGLVSSSKVMRLLLNLPQA